MNSKIIDRAGSLRIVDCGVGTYAVKLASQRSDDLTTWFNWDNADWDSDPVSVAGVRTVPWGKADNLPQVVRDLLESNNIGPGILQRKLGLIYGEGPHLYRRTITDDGTLQREWVRGMPAATAARPYSNIST